MCEPRKVSDLIIHTIENFMSYKEGIQLSLNYIFIFTWSKILSTLECTFIFDLVLICILNKV